MEVRRILRRMPVIVHPNQSLRDVAATLAEENVGAVLVALGGRLQGIFSERDLVTAIAEGTELDEAVELVMVTEPFTVAPSTSVGEAARVMTDKRVRHLPVVDDEGLYGIVSMRDLLYAALEETAIEARQDWVDFLLPDMQDSGADGG